MPTPGQLTFAVLRRSTPPRHLADRVLADRRTVVAEHGHQPFRADQLSRHYSKWTPSRPDVQQAFVTALEAHGIPVSVRDTRGSDIDGACGQLAAVDA